MRKCLLHNPASHAMCTEYLGKTAQEKVQLLKEMRACWCCLKIGHRSSDCRNKAACGIDNCNWFHHQSLHEAHTAGVGFHMVMHHSTKDYRQTSDACLLQLMRLYSKDMELSVLWDSGASISLITFKRAQELKLWGKQTSLSIIKVGDVVRLSSYIYKLPLVDKHGNIVHITVCGIEKISSDVEGVDVRKVVQRFKGLKDEEVRRPKGEIDVLIGYNYASLHPVKMQSVENLLLLGNRFGKCLAGCHDSIKERDNVIFHAVHISDKYDDFLSLESIGIQSPVSVDCKCGTYSIGSKGMTLQEEREQKLIKEGLTFKEGCWLAEYPWIRDPADLPNNEVAAMKMLESSERRLLKNNEQAAVYDDQIKDMLNRCGSHYNQR